MQWALMEGERTTGITSFFLNEEWDAGPICLQREIPVSPDENYGSLSKKCAEQGADLILDSLKLISRGVEQRVPQDDSLASFARLLNKEDLVIDWSLPARTLQNRIRGLTPKPGARTFWDKGLLRIQEAVDLEVSTTSRPADPGVLLAVGEEGIDVQCGNGVLRVLMVQPENKKPMRIKAFLNGYPVKSGSIWGQKPG